MSSPSPAGAEAPRLARPAVRRGPRSKTVAARCPSMAVVADRVRGRQRLALAERDRERRRRRRAPPTAAASATRRRGSRCRDRRRSRGRPDADAAAAAEADRRAGDPLRQPGRRGPAQAGHALAGLEQHDGPHRGPLRRGPARRSPRRCSSRVRLEPGPVRLPRLPVGRASRSWNVYADNPSSSAYGIPQALPGSKMSSAGADWATNPVTQIRWGLGYIAGPLRLARAAPGATARATAGTDHR